VTSEQRLALAVLAQAADDAAHLDPLDYAQPQAQLAAVSRRTTARAFLTGGPMLDFWCALAGLDAGQLAQLAQQRWRPEDALRPVMASDVTATAAHVTPATPAR
jgi:hypothetical protein